MRYRPPVVEQKRSGSKALKDFLRAYELPLRNGARLFGTDLRNFEHWLRGTNRPPAVVVEIARSLVFVLGHDDMAAWVRSRVQHAESMFTLVRELSERCMDLEDSLSNAQTEIGELRKRLADSDKSSKDAPPGDAPSWAHELHRRLTALEAEGAE